MRDKLVAPISLRKKVASVMALAIAITVGTGVAAYADQYQSSKLCNSNEVGYITFSSSAGSGTWTNYNNPSQAQLFSFGAGLKTIYSPYEDSYFQYTANVINGTPTKGCRSYAR